MHEHATIDLNSFKRKESSRELWQEIHKTQERRNAIVHRGEFPPSSEAETTMRVAEFLLDVTFPRVLRSVELHLHERHVCSARGTRICPGKPMPSIPSKPPAPSETLDELRDYIASQGGSSLHYFLRDTKLALVGDTLTVFSKARYLNDYKDRLERYASDLYRKKIVVQFVPPDSQSS